MQKTLFICWIKTSTLTFYPWIRKFKLEGKIQTEGIDSPSRGQHHLLQKALRQVFKHLHGTDLFRTALALFPDRKHLVCCFKVWPKTFLSSDIEFYSELLNVDNLLFILLSDYSEKSSTSSGISRALCRGTLPRHSCFSHTCLWGLHFYQCCFDFTGTL